MEKTTIITESQGIDILIMAGLSDGTERETSYYKKNGSINTGASLNAYLEKLEQIKTYVKLVVNESTGKPYGGKRRLIEIGEDKEEVSKRFDGRSNNSPPPTAQDMIMDECIMNILIKSAGRYEEGSSYTFGKWADNLHLFNIGEQDWSKLSATLNVLYTPYIVNASIDNTRRFLKWNVQTRRIALIKRSFNELERTCRIIVTEEYMSEEWIDPELYSEKKYEKLRKERFIDISEEEFKEIQDCEKEKVASLGIEWGAFIQAKFKSIFATKKASAILREVAEHLRETMNVEKYFIKQRVQVVDRSFNDNITYKDLDTAFVKRYIELTDERLIDNSDYTSGENYSKQLYRTNIFLLLKQIGFEEEYRSEIKEVTDNIYYNINMVKQVYRVAKELEREQERNNLAF